MIDILRKVAFGEPASARFFCLRWIARPLLFALPIPVVAAWCDIAAKLEHVRVDGVLRGLV